MSADSFHGIIEKEFRHRKNLYEFSEFVSVVNHCGEAFEMQPEDFKDVPRGMCSAAHTKKPKRIDAVSELIFVRGSTEMRWATNFDRFNYTTGQFLTAKLIESILEGTEEFAGRVCARGISKSKKADILDKLVPLMPKCAHNFWSDMISFDE